MGELRSSAAAFEQLVAPYEKQVYYLCLRMMGNTHDAQDCAQDAMLRAFRAFHSFRGEAKVSTWLYTIAHRACVDALRARKPQVSLNTLQEQGWDAEDTAPTPYAQLEQQERKRLLEQALTQLNEEQRAAIVLVDLQGLLYDEAAQVLDIPVGTLKSRIARGRQALAQLLKNYRELFAPSSRPNIEREGK